jgi:hypothetical protein
MKEINFPEVLANYRSAITAGENCSINPDPDCKSEPIFRKICKTFNRRLVDHKVPQSSPVLKK